MRGTTPENLQKVLSMNIEKFLKETQHVIYILRK